MLYDIPAHDIMFGSDPQDEGYFWVDVWGDPRREHIDAATLVKILQDHGVELEDTCVNVCGEAYSWDEVVELALARYL